MKSYIGQAWRRIAKDKGTSLLNIMGLSTGLACFAFIVLWAHDEFSYDKFNKNYERIVRITETATTETGQIDSARTSAPMAAALLRDYPEVENAVRLRMREELVVKNGQQISQPGILLADHSFFDVFSYELTRGNEATALDEPYTLILTESAAKAYFGEADPIGQSLTIFMNDTTGFGAAYRITGLVRDPPKNAHFAFTMLASFSSVEAGNPDVLTIDGWRDTRFYTYLLLKPGVDIKAFSKKASRFYEKYVGDAWGKVYSYQAQPLSDIYLRSNLQNEIGPHGSLTRVYVFLIVGVAILLLAGINYTNLATARSAARAKEIGLKKVVGAGRGSLVFQYLSESVLAALISLVVALLLSFLIRPYFLDLTGKNLSVFSNPRLLLFLGGVTIFLGVVSGIYPAFVLSAFKPMAALRGSFKMSGPGVRLRQGLVISQFAVTLVLITGIVIIDAQMNYIGNKDLGFNKNALVFVRVNGNTDVINGFEAFENALKANPRIRGIATSDTLIGGSLGSAPAGTVDRNGRPVELTTARLRADQHYLDVYHLKLLAGKNYGAKAAQEPVTPVLVNESAVKSLGWEHVDDALGKPFKVDNKAGVVIGVVGDFHFDSLQNEIRPLAIYPVGSRFSRINIKVDEQRPIACLELIEKTWKKHFPGALFDYGFLDEQIKLKYQAEERFSKVFLTFSGISLLIACLGLFGLAAYATSQRTKEIGIRKVLGASARRIVLMLSKDFAALVALASLISLPASWLIMNKWLENFAYHVRLSWWMFGFPILLVSTVALLAVSAHVIKSAVANPVQSLRAE